MRVIWSRWWFLRRVCKTLFFWRPVRMHIQYQQFKLLFIYLHFELWFWYWHCFEIQTMSVRAVMRNLKSEVDLGVLQPFCFIETNGMKLSSPNNIYKVKYFCIFFWLVKWLTVWSIHLILKISNLPNSMVGSICYINVLI